MPNVDWKTKEQHEFLLELFSSYATHQDDKTTMRFWGPTYEKWFSRWPVEVNDTSIATHGSSEMATSVLRRAREAVSLTLILTFLLYSVGPLVCPMPHMDR